MKQIASKPIAGPIQRFTLDCARLDVYVKDSTTSKNVCRSFVMLVANNYTHEIYTLRNGMNGLDKNIIMLLHKKVQV
jgi:hypothetical protein